MGLLLKLDEVKFAEATNYINKDIPGSKEETFSRLKALRAKYYAMLEIIEFSGATEIEKRTVLRAIQVAFINEFQEFQKAINKCQNDKKTEIESFASSYKKEVDNVKEKNATRNRPMEGAIKWFSAGAFVTAGHFTTQPDAIGYLIAAGAGIATSLFLDSANTKTIMEMDNTRRILDRSVREYSRYKETVEKTLHLTELQLKALLPRANMVEDVSSEITRTLDNAIENTRIKSPVDYYDPDYSDPTAYNARKEASYYLYTKIPNAKREAEEELLDCIALMEFSDIVVKKYPILTVREKQCVLKVLQSGAIPYLKSRMARMQGLLNGAYLSANRSITAYEECIRHEAPFILCIDGDDGFSEVLFREQIDKKFRDDLDDFEVYKRRYNDEYASAADTLTTIKAGNTKTYAIDKIKAALTNAYAGLEVEEKNIQKVLS